MSTVPFNLGDSLSKIAFEQLGDPTRFRELAQFNGIGNIFEQIPIGTELKIPSAAELQQLAKSKVAQITGQINLSQISQAINPETIDKAIKLVDFLY